MHLQQPSRWRLALGLAALAVGCSESPIPSSDAASPLPSDAASAITASCSYTNPFSMREECRDYLGAAWDAASVAADCANAAGALRSGQACSYPAALGTCLLNAERDDATRLTFPGSSAEACASTRTGCEVFARGRFAPRGVCSDGDGGVTDGGAASDASTGLGVFQQPVRECREPLAGQPRGAGPGGQVCTWSAISGATEEGRRFADYGSCERVRTQRPYYPRPAAPARGAPDPRLSNPAYVAELAWVRAQVEASACVCCHSTRTSPRGPSNWYVEAPGNWMDSFHPSGLALGAGWVDSASLGAYPPDQNNGFARTTSGVPSTDPARMARFFQDELASRGLTREAFRGATPFGGPIYSQLVYRPGPCTGADGVGADATVRWSGGPARYVYVLEVGSANPGVPPNLDLPAGTRWRLDVPATGTPVASGITYGRAPEGTTQRFPVSGSPQPLVAGSTYYLYVLADVGVPITRCLFNHPR